MSDRRFIFLILSIIIFATFVALFWQYSIDDAFITFKYAENLADGHGLVFNIGDKPVEGYSNFLWMLILSALYSLGLPTYLSAKLLGVVFILLTTVLWYRFFRSKASQYSWLSGMIFLVSPITAFWAVSGLELGLHMFLVSGAFITVIRRSNWSFLILPLLVLNRPEGAAVALTLVIVSALIDLRNGRPAKKLPVLNLTVITAAVVFIIIFRMIVFGYPFPNTFYAKSGNSECGFDQIFKMFLFFLPLTILFLAGAGKVIREKLHSREYTVAIVLFGVQSIISSMVNPVMNFHFRYMIPFLPLFIMVGFNALSYFKSRHIVWILIAVSSLSLFTPLSGVYRQFTRELKIMDAQEDLIGWLGSMPGIATVSLTDVGRIPYYTDKHFYDIWGLVSENIAHNGFNPLEEYLRFPDCFILVGHLSGNNLKLTFGKERLISQCRGFSKTYRFAGISMPAGADSTKSGYYYIRLLKDQRAVDSLLDNHPINRPDR